MTTLTLTPSDSSPLLVSELPPVPIESRRRCWSRRDVARFEATLRQAAPQERTDLLLAARRAG